MRQQLACIVLVASTLAASWLGMMAVHEFGHVLHAWISGGRVTRVVWHPLTISRTDVDPNPRPRFVAWGGPLWGTALPLIGWLLVRGRPTAWLPRFFAGFCLVANGGYLAAALVLPVGDAADLLRHGTPLWMLIVVGVAAMAAGLWLWHRLGRDFGIGPDAREVDRRTACGMMLLAGLLIMAGWLWSLLAPIEL